MEKRSDTSERDLLAISVEPLLSVIVPISNMAKSEFEIQNWVRDSVKEGIHVVLVHDLYVKSSGDFLRNLASQFPDEITYCEGHFGSPGAARNRGLLEVRGEWVSFWDSDDMPQVKSFLKMVRDAHLAGLQFAIGQYAEFDLSTGKVTYQRKVPLNKITAPLLIARRPGLWRMSFKWSTVKKSSYPNRNMGEDQIFIILSGINFRRTFLSKNIVYTYSRNFPGQLTQKTNRYENLQLLFENELETAVENITTSKSMMIMMTLRIWISLVRRGEYRNQFGNFLLLVKYIFRIISPRKTRNECQN